VVAAFMETSRVRLTTSAKERRRLLQVTKRQARTGHQDDPDRQFFGRFRLQHPLAERAQIDEFSACRWPRVGVA